MQFTHLSEWLTWQEQLHPNAIDLGLDRPRQVLQRLGWQPPKCPVFIVGGTNGKGSCVAMLNSILSAAGYRVGTFTSPHLIRYNERIALANREVSDASLMAAFERIDAARGDISLTFFEFNALAALLIFATANLDAWVLEVGLGGRLDAVNLVDADVAIVSSVALDHCDWLGYDVESIALEKAGIFRSSRVAIYGSQERPQSIDSEATRIGARLLRLGHEFSHTAQSSRWSWFGVQTRWHDLPRPALKGNIQFDNAAAVLTALESVRERLPIAREHVEHGLQSAQLVGRFQILHKGNPSEWIVDVAHNPAAAQTLADNLRGQSITPSGVLPSASHSVARTVAVCGMMADKDVDGVIALMCDQIDVWIAAVPGGGARALAATTLAGKLRTAGAAEVHVAANIASACELANRLATAHDRVVVFGSFFTVGPALEWLSSQIQ